MALDAGVEVVVESVAWGTGGGSPAEAGGSFEGGCRRARETLEGRGSTASETLEVALKATTSDLVLVGSAGQAVAGGGSVTAQTGYVAWPTLVGHRTKNVMGREAVSFAYSRLDTRVVGFSRCQILNRKACIASGAVEG